MTAKADRADGKGEVEGYYIKDSNTNRAMIGSHKIDMFIEINPQTLKYSFDGGKSWYSEEEIQYGLKLFAELQNIHKELNND